MIQPPSPWTEEMDDALGFLIADTARQAKRLLYARIAEHGIRGGSWYLLRALWERDGLTQRELSVRLGITEPSVQQVLRAMEDDGLIERTRDTEDRRKIRVHLSPRGRELKAPLMTVAHGLNLSALTALTHAEDVLLRRLLKLIRTRFMQESDALSARSAGQPPGLDLREESRVDERPVDVSAARKRSKVAGA